MFLAQPLSIVSVVVIPNRLNKRVKKKHSTIRIG